jgi:hypothetical protein
MEKRKSVVSFFQNIRDIRAVKRQQGAPHTMLSIRIVQRKRSQIEAENYTEMLELRRLPIQADVEHAG